MAPRFPSDVGHGAMRARLESPRVRYATPGFLAGTTRAPRRRQLPTKRCHAALLFGVIRAYQPDSSSKPLHRQPCVGVLGKSFRPTREMPGSRHRRRDRRRRHKPLDGRSFHISDRGPTGRARRGPPARPRRREPLPGTALRARQDQFRVKCRFRHEGQRVHLLLRHRGRSRGNAPCQRLRHTSPRRFRLDRQRLHRVTSRSVVPLGVPRTRASANHGAGSTAAITSACQHI